MKRLRFVYRMTLRYDPPIRRQRFTLKCLPVSSAVQRVETLTADVQPCVFLERGTDGFGNAYCYGLSEGLISCFAVTVQGSVLTGLAEAEAAPPVHLLGPYRYPTALTRPGEAVARLAGEAGEADEPLAYALRCMDVLSRRMAYVQGVTGMDTTAEQAAALGRGVCQDMTHVLLAMLRLRRIACRYVCGMMAGEGESHAWAEVCVGDRWIALDPTNRRQADDGYIRLCAGRDAADCLINRGIVSGVAAQSSRISVSVCEEPVCAEEGAAIKEGSTP